MVRGYPLQPQGGPYPYQPATPGDTSYQTSCFPQRGYVRLHISLMWILRIMMLLRGNNTILYNNNRKEMCVRDSVLSTVMESFQIEA